MNTVASSVPRIAALDVTEDAIIAQLVDGRTISVPLVWSWRLANATPQQRNRFEIIGAGEGVHWPDIDEDISARGMLLGIPACPPRQSETKRPQGARGRVVGHRDKAKRRRA
jgi:hypothetical protein